MKNSTLLINKINSRLAWKVLILMLLPLLQVYSLQAQGLKISNVNLNASGDVNIVLKDGGFTNNGTFIGGGESLKFKGTSAAEIGGGGAITLNSLTVDNTAGITLGANLTVTGTLDFQNGKIATGTNLLTMGPAGIITNAASSKYVEGRLAQTFSSLATKIFPIGKGGNYRPITLQYTQLTGTSLVTAEQFETAIIGTLPDDVSLMTTGRQWNITQTGGSNYQYFVTLDPTGYTPETPVVILKKDGETISAFESTSPNYTNSSAFNSFSYFALGEECVNPDNGGQIADNQTVCTGESADTITNNQYPSGFTGTLEYKWQISYTDGVSGFTDIAGTDTDEYAPASVTSTCWLKRVARVDCKTNWDGAAESNVVQITVNPGPVGGTLAGSASVCYGTNTTLLTLSGYENEIVRWEYTDNNWSNIIPITHTYDTMTVKNLVTTTQFRVVVKKGDCDLVYSDTATITVYEDFNPGAIHTIGETICSGDDPVEIGDSIVASGGNGTINYQWQKKEIVSKKVEEYEDIPLATGASYNPPPGLTKSTVYRRTAWDETCNTIPEESAGEWMVTVYEPPTANAGGPTWLCEGDSYTLQDGEATATYGDILWTHNGGGTLENETTLTPTYIKGTSFTTGTFTDYDLWNDAATSGGAVVTLDDFSSLEEVNANTLIRSTGVYDYTFSVAAGYLYRLTEDSDYGQALSTQNERETLTLIFNSEVNCFGANFFNDNIFEYFLAGDITIDFNGNDEPAPITVTPADYFINSFVGYISETPITSVTISTTVNGGYCAIDNLRFSNVSEVPDKTVTLTMTVTNSPCDPAQDSYTITFDDFTHGAIATTGETIWKGDDAASIGSETDASGGDEAIVYKWQSSLNETFNTPVDLASSNSATYDPGTLNETTWFRRLVHDGNCYPDFEPSAGIWKVTVDEPVFQDDKSNKSLTWQEALLQAGSSGAGTITLQKNYTQIADASISNNHLVDLNGKTFAGGKVNTIEANKSFGFFNSLDDGTFDNEIHFQDGTSTLVILDKFTPGPLFTTANSTSSGKVQIGNGIDPFIFSLNSVNETLFTKVNRVMTKNGVMLNMEGGLNLAATVQLDDGSVVNLSDGNFTQNFSSTSIPSSAAIHVGVTSAASPEISGDLQDFAGSIVPFNGSALHLNLSASVHHPFGLYLSGSSSVTKVVKKGGDYTIGNVQYNNNVIIGPYGELDLSDDDNQGILGVNGILTITNYNSPNVGKIRFRMFNDAGEIKTYGLNFFPGTIITDDPIEGQVDVSKHFIFDFNNVTGTYGQSYHIPVASVTSGISLTGSPVPVNAPGWKDFEVNTNSGTKNGSTTVYLEATYDPCINPTDPGTIEFEYSICLGEDPYEMYGSAPSGYNGTLEYKWQNSLVDPDDPDFEDADFTDIFDTDTDTYLPSSVSQTTWFRRGAKVTCDASWVYSNIIEVTVNLPSRRYVTMTGAGFMDGLDWDNAYDSTMLQDAISESCVNEVWVAEGTYLPTQMVGDEGDKYFAFQLANGVAVYGGFAGTEDNLSQRFIIDHPTILSGDMNQDDDYSVKPWDNTSDNVYHVVHLEDGLDLDSTARLDGFIIQGGYSLYDGKANLANGGGIYVNNNSPYISNCVIRYNYADIAGGGVNFRGESNYTMLTNCMIYNNIAGIYGGGVYAGYHTLPTLNNLTITGNSSEGTGGGIQATVAAIDVNNCIIWGNSAADSGNQIYYMPFGGKGFSSFLLNNSCYSNGYHDVVDEFGEITYTDCTTDDPLMIDPDNGDYRIYGISPCADAGNNDFNNEPYDIRGSGFERILDKGFTKGPGALIDIGAYEYKDGGDPKAPCTNTANGGEIGNDETVCQDSIPSEIQNLTLPSGHSGDLEFRWEMSTTSESSGFTVISGAIDTTYQPGALTDTTWFRRIVRVDCKPDWSGADTSNVVKITMEPTPVAGTLVKSPDQANVCNGDFVSATLTGSSGGNGIDSQQYRTHDGISWSTWTDYVPAASVTTTSVTQVEIRSWRNGNTCAHSDTVSVSWNMYPEFNPGVIDNETLVKYPFIENTAYSESQPVLDTSFLDFTNLFNHYIGDDGFGNVLETYPACGAYNYTLAIINDSYFTLDATTDTEVDLNSLVFEVAKGGSSDPRGYFIRSSIDGFASDLIYEILPAGDNQAPVRKSLALGASYHNITSVTFRFYVFTPDCAGYSVDWRNLAIIKSSGETICYNGDPSEIGNAMDAAGGDGTITYSWYQSTTNFADSLLIAGAASAAYNPPPGLTENTYYRRYAHDGTCNTDFEVSSGTWTVITEPTPVAGTLAKTPDVSSVCEGEYVSAGLTPGSGGNGTDITQFRTHDGTEWSTWTDYALLASVTTTAKTGVEIRTWRTGTQCSNSDTTSVSWIIEQTPVSGTLAKTPDAEYVCEGDMVSAELTEGTGGNGTDSLSYRTHNGTLWSSWQAYTSETEISTTGMDTVEIQTLRKADYCTDATVVKESWKIEPTPVSGSLAKTPDADYVCEGDKVSAELTAGAGGNGTDSLSYRTHNGTLWSSWQAYTSETEISTTGIDTVAIQTIRKADYCSDATAVTERWIIEQTPLSGTLTKTPDKNLICQGDKVSASLNPGSGGNGTDSLAYRTFNGVVWSAWQSYLPDSDIATDNVTRVEIQTMRLADACDMADADTVRWAADLTPPVVTSKTNVSVTLDPTGNYTLLATDLLQSWTDAGVGIQSVSIEPETVSCSDLGSKIVLVTVSDNCDNQTEVNMTITVVDNTDLGDWESCNTHTSAYGTSVYSPCVNTGNFKLTSKGKSSATVDVMHFVYKPLTGNGTIIARLDDVKSDGYAGVMMRESCAPGSKVVLFKTRLYNPNVLVGYRKYTNKTIYNMSQVYQLLRWMKIQRNGNTFQVFVSYNGTTWLRSYSTTIEMSSTILAGIFTENYLTNRTTEAWFDHVELYNSLKLGYEFSGDETPDPESVKPDVLIYPNPATDELTITLIGVGELSGYKATLISSEGRMVQTFIIREINTLLDVSALQPGIYTLRIEDHENVLIRRLVIQ